MLLHCIPAGSDARMACHSQVKTDVSMDEPLFQPFPAHVVFSNYQPQRDYEVTLYLRNNDNVSGRSFFVLLLMHRMHQCLCSHQVYCWPPIRIY